MSKKKKKKAFDPVKDTGTVTPVRATVSVRDANDKYSEYPSEGLTPRRLAVLFKEADSGDVRRQMELFEEMEEKDTHLFSQLQTRKLAVTGLSWEIQPFSEDELDKEIAEFVKDQMNSLESLDEILIDLMDAVGKGISLMEIEWGVDLSGHNVIESIEHVTSKKLIWDWQTDEMKLCTRDYPMGVSLPDNKFVIHKYKAKSGHPSRAGVLRICAWMYLFKNYDIKDWVSFAEVYGQPLRLGKYSASSSEDDKRALREALESLGTDAAGVVPDSTIIEFIESNKTSTVEIYEKLARYCDEQMSKAILGQTLTSDSGGGSYAQSKTHDNVRHDLLTADAKALATTIRRDIIRPLVVFNFGSNANIPFFDFDVEEAEDLKDLIEIYKGLAGIGLEIPKAHLYKKFNIPKPESGEEVIKIQQAQSNLNFDRMEMKTLKSNGIRSTQDVLDQMADKAVRASEASFEEMMIPILKMIDTSDDLHSLKAKLENPSELKRVLEEMQNKSLTDLVAQSIYLSEAIGRCDDT